jgi:hypothetical protein
LVFIESNWKKLHTYFDLKMENAKPNIPTFHPTPSEKEARIGKYYYTIDESLIWKDDYIYIKHLHI